MLANQPVYVKKGLQVMGSCVWVSVSSPVLPICLTSKLTNFLIPKLCSIVFFFKILMSVSWEHTTVTSMQNAKIPWVNISASVKLDTTAMVRRVMVGHIYLLQIKFTQSCCLNQIYFSILRSNSESPVFVTNIS